VAIERNVVIVAKAVVTAVHVAHVPSANRVVSLRLSKAKPAPTS
jgi:hypothetical protein